MSTPAVRRIAIGTAAIIAIDLTTKLAAATLAAGQRSGPIVPVQNPEFSLGTARGPVLIMILLAAAGIALAAHYTLRPALRGELPSWIPVLLVGGALANLIDRAAFGAVHDFLATPWIILNLADIAVVAGLAGLATHHHTRARGSTEATP